MREVARSTTTPGRPSEYWTYMLSSQSRAGNCGHAGSVAKRLKIRSTRGCATVCGKLPTSECAAKKRGCSILPLLGSGENHTASTPCTISEIRTSCSEAQYNSKTRVLRARVAEGVSRAQPFRRHDEPRACPAGQTLVQSPYFRQTAPELWWLSRVCGVIGGHLPGRRPT